MFEEERLGKLEAWVRGVDQRDTEESRVRKMAVEQKESNSDAGEAHCQCNPNFSEGGRERE